MGAGERLHGRVHLTVPTLITAASTFPRPGYGKFCRYADRMSHATQPKRQRAIDLVLAGRSHTEVATELGCRRETVWRWSGEPAFAAEISARRVDRRGAVAAELDAGALDAVRLLRSLVGDAEAPAAARVRAAAELLDRAGVTSTVAVEIRTDTAPESLELQRFREALPAMSREELEAVLVRLTAARGGEGSAFAMVSAGR